MKIFSTLGSGTLVFFLVISTACMSYINDDCLACKQPVRVVGKMRDVMFKGELQGKIHLDTIATKKHLYGIGPQEYLSGELTIIDGVSYRSVISKEKEMVVDSTYQTKAPFFVYANVAHWREMNIPDSVKTLLDLETYISAQTTHTDEPFAFRLIGKVDSAVIHVVNLPKGKIVRSPEDSHTGQVNFNIKSSNVEMIGFYSKHHQSIFTHHDSYMHLHLITADHKLMGHLDKVNIAKGSMKILFPQKILSN